MLTLLVAAGRALLILILQTRRLALRLLHKRLHLVCGRRSAKHMRSSARAETPELQAEAVSQLSPSRISYRSPSVLPKQQLPTTRAYLLTHPA